MRHGLGLTFLGETMKSDWILADIHLKGYPFPESELAIYWHERGVLAFFPISPGRFRIIADVSLSQAAIPRIQPSSRCRPLSTGVAPAAWLCRTPFGCRDFGSTSEKWATIARAAYSWPAMQHTCTVRPAGKE